MKPPIQRDELASLTYGLTEESVEFRNRWRLIVGGAVWLVLSGLTMILTIFSAEQNMHRAVIIVLSFLKYIPLMLVVYSLARQRAAHYLDDIFELHNEDLAADFIEEVAFGYGHEHITINDGKISEMDEHSPIILIGGPGQIQVNLGSAALLEKLNGEPEIIYARRKPWELGRFERIREIGKHDKVGKREYAVINLRDQFVNGLSVRARTKDGIPIEALDIKVLFSILRNRPHKHKKSSLPENDPYPFEEQALHALVYNQTIITPPPSTPSGVSFPWDTTVIPLITTELEKLITSRTLSELLASISQKEVDALTANEDTVAQMRVEMTGGQTIANGTKEARPPNFESRTRITAQFLGDEFREKAASLGVAIEWIDIGTWHLPSNTITEKLKEAWKLTREVVSRRGAVERSAKTHQMEKIVELVNNVVIENYERSASLGKYASVIDQEELRNFIDNNPNVKLGSEFLKQFKQQYPGGKDEKKTATRILNAFRRELFAARYLIEKENKPDLELREDLAKIDKALRDIAQLTSHFV
jgi:hypothetical protein